VEPEVTAASEHEQGGPQSKDLDSQPHPHWLKAALHRDAGRMWPRRPGLPCLAIDTVEPERSANCQNQLAPQVASFADTVSFRGVCKGIA